MLEAMVRVRAAESELTTLLGYQIGVERAAPKLRARSDGLCGTGMLIWWLRLLEAVCEEGARRRTGSEPEPASDREGATGRWLQGINVGLADGAVDGEGAAG